MASRPDTELLTEHFGYPPVSLLDEIINAVNFLAERALHSIEQGLLNAPPASLGFRPEKPSSRQQQQQNGTTKEHEEERLAQMHRDEVESGVHALETLLWASIDKNFDRFEIYVMRNILCVREGEMEWMKLGHYEGLEFPEKEEGEDIEMGGGGEGTGEEGGESSKPTVESVNKLRRRLQASQRLHAMLVAERARNAALLGEMRRLIGGVGTIKTEGEQHQPDQDGQQQKPPFRFLRDKGDLTEGDAETPLTTTTAFTLSQLPALRELSTSLRGVIPELAASASASGEEGEDEVDKDKKKSWRRERLEYVETATRKHLENIRGLELGKNGEVRDGEWYGGGRSLARGEVESLEKAITMLGGGREEGDRGDES